MPAAFNPIKRVWKPKAPAAVPEQPQPQPQFDVYGHEILVADVNEKNTDSIWDTYDALQAAEAARLDKLTRP